jgi:hypothetical protein
MKPFVRSASALSLTALTCLIGVSPALAGSKPFDFEDGRGRGSMWCVAFDPPTSGVGKIVDPFVRALKGRRVEVGLLVQRPRDSLYQTVRGNISASDLGGGVLRMNYPFDDRLQLGWYNTPPNVGFNVGSVQTPIVAEAQGGVYFRDGRIGFEQNGNPEMSVTCTLPQDLDQLDETEQNSIKVLLGLLVSLFSRGRVRPAN